MNHKTEIHCRCGQVRLNVAGTPIASVECCCTSCREAATRLQLLDGAPRYLTEFGATPFVLYRKDRVNFLSGQHHLKEFRLSPASSTRRVVAGCCNTPIFLEFKGGHWLSLYGQLWPDGMRPPLEMRTMTVDLGAGVKLPDDVPNLKRQSLAFFGRLFRAWAGMGFRSPTIEVKGEVNA